MASRAHRLGVPSRLPLATVLASIPSYPRPVIERLVAKMIDHLDEKDSPAEDLEDDDPGGGADDAEPEHDLFPDYGGDQSRGPIGYGYEPKPARWSPATNW